MTAPTAPTRSRRAPVLVVLLALVLGSMGLAGTAYGAGLTGKQVKKIAAKVVKKQAPKLSVKHAKTADSAKTAGSATTAGTAGNATNLGGLAATAYLDRAVQASTTGNTAVQAGTTTQILNPTPISVPAGVTRVRVDATVGWGDQSDNNVLMWIQRDGPCVDSGTDFNNGQFGNSGTQGSITVNRLFIVTPNSSPSFRMCVLTGDAISVDNRYMVIQTVALDG